MSSDGEKDAPARRQPQGRNDRATRVDPAMQGSQTIGRRAFLMTSSSLVAGSAVAGLPTQANAELLEYKPGTTFPGRIGRTIEDSEPAWPRPIRAKPGAPNVVYIVLDDTGFGQLGCYGSPISTPNLDRLAANGLLYNNMHTTALCSPTRSCMLTGRNHHSNAMACITEGSTGYPGRQRRHPVRERLSLGDPARHGYSTYAVGKWHLTPAEQMSAAGPYDRWPLGRGFDRYYGFLGGDTHQYYPDLVYDNHQVDPPKTPEEGYHLTEDLADKAIGFIADSKQVAPDKPFFLYFATGAMHAPHQVPKEWADKYKGKFDDGWDAYREKVFARQMELGIVPQDTELSRHDPDVPAWDGLSPDERRLYARMMEVFAGFLEHTDHHIGRLVDYPRADGRARQHAHHGHLRQRRQLRGRADRLGQREQVLQQRARDLQENLAAIDDLGGPEILQSLSVGLGLGGRHAVQALEARDLPRRRQRPVHRPLAQGHQGEGRGPHPVRPRHRHGADGAARRWASIRPRRSAA